MNRLGGDRQQVERDDGSSSLTSKSHAMVGLGAARQEVEPRRPDRMAEYPSTGTILTMSTEFRLDPELASVVERSRRRARELGELPHRPAVRVEAAIPVEAREIVAGWLRDGGYEAAVAAIGAEDPDLANE